MSEIAPTIAPQDIIQRIEAAHARIQPYIRETPVEHSPVLSQLTGAEVWLKLENLQLTGSFKLRGAMNKLLSLTPTERAVGVVTASTGNHGAATAYAMQQLGCSGVVFVPHDASPAKLENIRQFGAKIETHGIDSVETEIYARDYAAQRGMTYVSPYNDLDVMCGQGTIGVELVRQLTAFDAAFVSVGGGGLMGGISAYLKNLKFKIENEKWADGNFSFSILNSPFIVGCQPVNSAVMAASVQAGHILDLPSSPTLSDGTAGGVEADTVTFPYCRDGVDAYELVSEDEIVTAMRLVIERHHTMIEGAAGVAVAALLKQRQSWRGKRVVVVLCGANISLDKLRAVLSA